MSIADRHQRCAQKFYQLSELLPAVPPLPPPPTASVHAVKSDIDEEQDRYILWAENAGAHQSGSNSTLSLDYRLREAPFYRDRVIDLLAVLERYLDKSIAIRLGSSQINQDDIESESGSDSQLFSTEYGEEGEAAAIGDDESSSWDISDTDSNLSLKRSRDQAPITTDHEGEPESRHSIPLHGIRHTIDCFYQLPLRRPAPISRLREQSEHELSYYEPYDVLYVRDKFPHVDEAIAARLGKLITRRRQLLAYRKGHQDRLQKTSIARETNAQSVTKSVAEETASEPTIRAESQRTRITDLTKATTTADDDRTRDTLYSVPGSRPATSVAASETTRKVRLHIPPRPLPKTRANESGINIPQTEKTRRTEFFECNYCRLLPIITSDLAWKRHVLSDLQPYVCTFSECELSSHFFADRDVWYAHEKQQHRLEYHCNTVSHPSFRDKEAFIKHMRLAHEMHIQLRNFNTMKRMFLRPVHGIDGNCNLCGVHTGNIKLHVSRHLEQLALFAVPRIDYTGCDDDDEGEDGDSNAARKDLEDLEYSSSEGDQDSEKLRSDDERILDIANGIALHYGKTTCWSTWHFWDFYCRQLPGGGVADPPPASEQIWSATAPFGSSVDISLQTTAALRDALSHVPDLQHYAEHVRTLARAGLSNQQDELTHCITALLANEFCILLDFSYNHNAMLIPCRSSVELQSYYNMDGTMFIYHLMYDNLNGVPTVFMLCQNEATETEPVKTPFQEFDEGELIKRINIRLAMETNALGVPKTKIIKFQTFMSQAPELIFWAQFDGVVLATTCLVKVDFENQKVLMQVPYHDWLLQEENSDLLHAARTAGVFTELNSAACNLVVQLKCPKHCGCSNHLRPVNEQIEVLARVGQRHGVETAELHRWIDSIYEIHNELDSSKLPG